MFRSKKKNKNNIVGTPAINAANPIIKIKEVTDSFILDQNNLVKEAEKQCTPIINGDKIINDKEFIYKYTARKYKMKNDTVENMLNRNREIKDLIKGANPQGKTKEVVAAYEYRKLQNGDDSGVVNAPKHNSPNVKDIRLSPDDASKRDLVFKIDIGDDKLILAPGGQVKTGEAKYIADSLCEMAKKKSYGKTAILDAKFVNNDGTPRIGEDAFTPQQARKIKEAGIRLRGVKDLDKRGEALLENLKKAELDGLNPVEREQLIKLRNDIAKAYSGKAVAGRMLGGAAIAFATAAVISMIIQYNTNKKIEVRPLLESSGKAAGTGVLGVLFDAGLYKFAIKKGKAPEVAKIFAQEGVTSGFCLIAAVADIANEVKSAYNGDISILDSIAGSSLKTAIDLLPIVLMPLGFAGVPISMGTQIGGRWILSKLRNFDTKIKEEIAEDFMIIRDIEEREANIKEMSEDMDKIFKEIGLSY
ncbi:hypothetical protein [Clostridium sp. C8-1-8]|uniref:hypothetical protein n=1 Tax=Clostridium sp. C8-1-8 TaxID=2698831 RepID=UPI00136BA761|nr:hypothetical protein [Clostridium sp. C8-1-8]